MAQDVFTILVGTEVVYEVENLVTLRTEVLVRVFMLGEDGRIFSDGLVIVAT